MPTPRPTFSIHLSTLSLQETFLISINSNDLGKKKRLAYVLVLKADFNGIILLQGAKDYRIGAEEGIGNIPNAGEEL